MARTIVGQIASMNEEEVVVEEEWEWEEGWRRTPGRKREVPKTTTRAIEGSVWRRDSVGG